MPNRPATRPSRRTTVVVAIATLLALEGAARLVAVRLPPTTAWPSSDYVRHDAALRDRGRLDTLVVGSSVAGVALRPDEIPSWGSGYNHWLAGPGMRSVADLTRLVLLDRVAPRRLVIGVTMREFNDGPSQRAHHEAMVSSHGFRDATGAATAFDRADETLRSVSVLAGQRDLLRDPVRLIDRVGAGRPRPERLGADGHLADRGDGRLSDERPEHVEQEREAMADYAFSEAGLRALDLLLRECGRRGIEVLVVNLPVTRTFIGFASRGAADQADFEERVRSTAERRGATWFDAFEETWDDRWFADVNHLNDTGEARLRKLIERSALP